MSKVSRGKASVRVGPGQGLAEPANGQATPPDTFAFYLTCIASHFEQGQQLPNLPCGPLFADQGSWLPKMPRTPGHNSSKAMAGH